MDSQTILRLTAALAVIRYLIQAHDGHASAERCELATCIDRVAAAALWRKA